jgi:hypothetical protein
MKEREDWRRGIFELRDYVVLKYPRIMQSLMYLLEYDRDQVCQKKTNSLYWKDAKKLLNDEFINKMMHF